jgi:Spy/CpxP family protein refolding chaperone
MERSRSALSPGLLLGVGVLLAAVALAQAAAARPPGEGPDHLAGLERRVADLVLDAETREACYAEIDAARASQRILREEMLVGHDRMRELLEREEPVEEEVMAQADHLAGLVGEVRKNELRTYLRILALLDADERAAMREGARHHREDRFPPEDVSARESF